MYCAYVMRTLERIENSSRVRCSRNCPQGIYHYGQTASAAPVDAHKEAYRVWQIGVWRALRPGAEAILLTAPVGVT